MSRKKMCGVGSDKFKKREKKTSKETHNDLHLRVGSQHFPNHLGVRVYDDLGRASGIHIVGTKHELNDVGRRLLQPACKVRVGNVDGLPARVAFVMKVKPWSLGLAVFHVARHGPEELDLVGKVCISQLIPY